jgi:hypothetical protein
MTKEKDLKALRAFFHDQLTPLAERQKREGRQFLASELQKDAESYYVRRTKRSMTRADFEWGGCPSVEAFPEQLAELWRSQGDEGLAALAPVLGKLAVVLQEQDDEGEEVSPFIYAMY